VTAAGLALFAVLVGYVAVTHSDEEGAHQRDAEVPDVVPT
jgi:hypothetical protein